MRPLFPHQAKALAMLRNSVARGVNRVVMQAPTGFGKTVLAAAIVEGALAKNRRVLFTVPALSLVDQTIEAFWSEGIRDIGVIQGNHELTNGLRSVQVASVQTLMRREVPDVDVVVIDEVHRWFEFYPRWMAMEAWRKVPFIGLSATPWTRGLGKCFDELIVAATTAELIEAGYLSRFRVYAPAHPDLTGVSTMAGDYHEGELSAAMDKPPLIADVVETWRRLGEDRPTLCFGVDRAHAKHLQGRFLEAGIATDYIDAYTEPEDRERIKRRFHAGETRVVCNVGCLTTGVDWDVRCIVLARPTKSEMLFTQIIGRGLRTAPGKADCLILDHSDTHLRLGFVSDIHHDRLDDGKPQRSSESRRQATPLPKECSKCSFLKPPRVHACPACGFAPERQSEVEFAEGSLSELKAGKPRPTMAEKQRWFSMLIWVARSRGYKSGWAANQYRTKFGVWPRGLSEVAVEPDLEVLGYVRHSLIKYAKGRKAAVDAGVSPA